MSQTSVQAIRSTSRACILLGAALLMAAIVLLLGSTGTAQAEDVNVTSPGPKWLDFFCIDGEQCAVGDFDGDGDDDVAVFYRDTRGGSEQGDVMVALSLGDRFDTPAKWADSFCTGAQVCKVGDFNNDQKDDLIAFNPKTTGQVAVALSNGAGFDPATVWNSYFCIGDEVCDVGNFDGKLGDDIVLFKRSAYSGEAVGDVVVALSNGSTAFNAATTPWHPFFCIGTETCGVGDFDGDGDDDIIAFAKGSVGTVYVALSTRTSFGTSGSIWHSFFCAGDETCAIGDFTGDNRDDILTFLKGGYSGSTEGDVYVAASKGDGFGDGWLWNPYFCLAGEVCMAGDFNNDDRADVVRFVRDTQSGAGRGDVYVALAAGADPRFLTTPPSGKWQETFCGPNEVCTTGDVNGDGKADAITFVRNAQTGTAAGDVLVAISTGAGFGPPQIWHDGFCGGDETCRVGDVNGDGLDDILAFARGTSGDVWVALSNGSTAFTQTAIWNYYFCDGQQVCEVGDVNGDGYDDIVAFARGDTNVPATGDVFVGLSNGSSFANGVKWQEAFCVLDEQCKVGDVNGDGRADILAFTRGTSADVWVGLSTGARFANGVKWHDFFCVGSEVCAVGDFNGDGRTDVASFLRSGYDTGSAGDVYVGLSTGRSFASGPKWHDFFCISDEVCGVGDFNGDAADDVITFTRGTAKDVYVALSNHSIAYFNYLGVPLQNPIRLPLIRAWY